MGTLIDWVTGTRVEILEEEDATPAFIRGYMDAMVGIAPNCSLFVGLPLDADCYHRGYGLAVYDMGPQIGEEIAA